MEQFADIRVDRVNIQMEAEDATEQKFDII